MPQWPPPGDATALPLDWITNLSAALTPIGFMEDETDQKSEVGMDLEGVSKFRPQVSVSGPLPAAAPLRKRSR